jgi:hypothetical protein
MTPKLLIEKACFIIEEKDPHVVFLVRLLSDMLAHEFTAFNGLREKRHCMAFTHALKGLTTSRIVHISENGVHQLGINPPNWRAVGCTYPFQSIYLYHNV